MVIESASARVWLKESMKAQIKFGTSGWRAIMADEFTFANVRRAVVGVARHVSSLKPSGARVIVGRDPRFLGESFVALAADILAEHGIVPIVVTDPAPTPAIAYEIVRTKTDGGINFTASHNPAEYNGIKFSTPDGAPALPEVTKSIEAAVAAADAETTPAAPTANKAERQEVTIKKEYLSRLKQLVDIPAIKASGMKIAFDPLWGASRGYSDVLLREAGVDVTTIHDFRDVLFGGHAPAPDDEYFHDLKAAMKKSSARIGIACDGDADRFGIVDDDGTFISPNYVIALLFDYIVESRGWKNGVAKSVVTTNMVNALASQHKIPLYETPVGFKYIGELIMQDKIAIGGEESAGLSIRGHVPEKDGVLAGLLCCEMVAKRGYSLKQQLKRLFNQVGSFYPVRENFRLTPEVKAKFTAKLAADPRELDGRKVVEVVRKDGLKLIFQDGSWVCFRLSGTEPVVRVYSEARSEADCMKLSVSAKRWIET